MKTTRTHTLARDLLDALTRHAEPPSPLLCAHANEVQASCPCDVSCFCRREGSCATTPGDIRRHYAAEEALGAAPVGSLDAVLTGYARKIRELEARVRRLEGRR